MNTFKAIPATAIAVFTLSAHDSANAGWNLPDIYNVSVQEVSFYGAHYVILEFNSKENLTPNVTMLIEGDTVTKVGSLGKSHTLIFPMPAPTPYEVYFKFHILGIPQQSGGIGSYVEHETNWYEWGGGFSGGL